MSNQQQPEQQAQPTPSDVKQSVNPAKQKQEQGKQIKKSVAKMSSRKWGLFGLRSLSRSAELASQTLELSALKMRLDAEHDILSEYELSPEELQSLMNE